jgi:hypothetical protein
VPAPNLAAVGTSFLADRLHPQLLSTVLLEGGNKMSRKTLKSPRIDLGKNVKLTLLVVSGFLFIVSASAFVKSRAQARLPLKAATMQIRIYTQKFDGSIEEKGTKTFHQAADGSYTVIRRDKAGHLMNTIIGDKTLDATFLVKGKEATKVLTGIGPDSATLTREYKGMRGYSGEIVLFGEVAFIQRTTQEETGANSEVATIPSLKHPVKSVTFNDDGSQTIEETISIQWGEPAHEKVKLAPDVRVSGEFDPFKKKGEAKNQ